MGGRGGSSGTQITVPDKKRRGPAGTRRKKIKIDQPDFPVGTTPPKPAGGAQSTEGAKRN
jgi:hypothetical protein